MSQDNFNILDPNFDLGDLNVDFLDPLWSPSDIFKFSPDAVTREGAEALQQSMSSQPQQAAAVSSVSTLAANQSPSQVQKDALAAIESGTVRSIPSQQSAASNPASPEFEQEVEQVDLPQLFSVLDYDPNDDAMKKELAKFSLDFSIRAKVITDKFRQTVKTGANTPEAVLQAQINMLGEFVEAADFNNRFWKLYINKVIRKFNRKFCSAFSYDPLDPEGQGQTKVKTMNFLTVYEGSSDKFICAVVGLKLSNQNKLIIQNRIVAKLNTDGTFDFRRFKFDVDDDEYKEHKVFAVSGEGLVGNKFAQLTRKGTAELLKDKNIPSYTSPYMTNPFEGRERDVLIIEDAIGLPSTMAVMITPSDLIRYSCVVIGWNFNLETKDTFNTPEDMSSWIPSIGLNNAVEMGMTRKTFSPLFAKNLRLEDSEARNKSGRAYIDLTDAAFQQKPWATFTVEEKILYNFANWTELYNDGQFAGKEVLGVVMKVEGRGIPGVDVTYNENVAYNTRTFGWRNDQERLDPNMQRAGALLRDIISRNLTPTQYSRAMTLLSYLRMTEYVGESDSASSLGAAQTLTSTARAMLLEWMVSEHAYTTGPQTGGGSRAIVNKSFLTDWFTVKAAQDAVASLDFYDGMPLSTNRADRFRPEAPALRALVERKISEVASVPVPTSGFGNFGGGSFQSFRGTGRPGWRAPVHGAKTMFRTQGGGMRRGGASAPLGGPRTTNLTRIAAAEQRARVMVSASRGQQPVVQKAFAPPPAVQKKNIDLSIKPGMFVVDVVSEQVNQRIQAAGERAVEEGKIGEVDLQYGDGQNPTSISRMHVDKKKGLGYKGTNGPFYDVLILIDQSGGKADNVPMTLLPHSMGHKKFFAVRYPGIAKTDTNFWMQEIARNKPLGERGIWRVSEMTSLGFGAARVGTTGFRARYNISDLVADAYTRFTYPDGSIVIIRTGKKVGNLFELKELAVHHPNL